MSIVRVGSTQEYADGWDAAFGKSSKKSGVAGKRPKSTAKTPAAKSTATKKSTKKAAAKRPKKKGR